MQLQSDELLFFNAMPQMLPIYEVLREKLIAAYPDVTIKVSKMQISFSNRHIFAMASLPWKRRKGWPEEYLLVSFGLSYKKESPRIAYAVEAYPNRWTHHVIVEQAGEIDRELMEWLQEAYAFSLIK